MAKHEIQLKIEARKRQLSTLKQYQKENTVTQIFVSRVNKHRQDEAVDALIGKEAGVSRAKVKERQGARTDLKPNITQISAESRDELARIAQHCAEFCTMLPRACQDSPTFVRFLTKV